MQAERELSYAASDDQPPIQNRVGIRLKSTRSPKILTTIRNMYAFAASQLK
jgi:hypothetical protein